MHVLTYQPVDTCTFFLPNSSVSCVLHSCMQNIRTLVLEVENVDQCQKESDYFCLPGSHWFWYLVQLYPRVGLQAIITDLSMTRISGILEPCQKLAVLCYLAEHLQTVLIMKLLSRLLRICCRISSHLVLYQISSMYPPIWPSIHLKQSVISQGSGEGVGVTGVVVSPCYTMSLTSL